MTALSSTIDASPLLLLSQSVALSRIEPEMKREFPQQPLAYFSDLRKALGFIKKHKPQIIIAEFIYAPTYGSQLSNFEALSATLQRHSPLSRFIALVAKADRIHIVRLGDNVQIDVVLDLPLNFTALAAAIRQIQN